MSPLNALVLGLGLFFLGMRLVGENLRGLCGGGFRDGLAMATKQPVLRGLIGFLAGALMQSATAVTFLCVSMVAAGLMTAVGAGVVIIWSNVGLTVLAFVATLDIHPLVAYVVGGSGIALGVIRVRFWQTLAGAMLGIGLILMGLEQMSAGAGTLKDAAWFHQGLSLAMSSSVLTFFAGFLVAALLQSNTGATMMVITLAGAGAVSFEAAALLIYGTNLGAIPLRVLLSSVLRGEASRLVRLEDLFCVLSGVLMLGLYFVEMAGVPLVFAFSGILVDSVQSQLAVVFLLSNLLAALVLTPTLPLARRFLCSLWPGEAAEVDGVPKYLLSGADADPSTALHLMRKELARLALMVTNPAAPADAGEDAPPPPGFQRLSAAIESFAARLASRSALGEADAARLHQLRAVLSGVRHVEDAVGGFLARGRVVEYSAEIPGVAVLRDAVLGMTRDCAAALDRKDAASARSLREATKAHGAAVTSLREKAFPESAPGQKSVEVTALLEDFRIAVWSIHRLAKLVAAIC